MHISPLLTLALAAILPFTLAKDDDPASSDAAASAAEDACYAKTLATGSGAASAIKGFCSQVENNDSNTDNPNSLILGMRRIVWLGFGRRARRVIGLGGAWRGRDAWS